MLAPRQVREAAELADKHFKEQQSAGPLTTNPDEPVMAPVNDNPPMSNPVSETAEYKALEDRFKKFRSSNEQTVHGLRTQVNELSDQLNASPGNEAKISELTDLVKSLESKLEETMNNPEPQLSAYDALTPELKEEIDPEFANAMGQISEQSLNKYKQEQAAENKKREDKKKEEDKQQKELDKKRKLDERARDEATMFGELDVLLPTWEELQAHHGFNEFMAVTAEGHNQPRGALVDIAFQELNASIIAYWYKQFAAENGLSIQKTEENPSLESHQIPESRGGEGHNQPQGQLYTELEWQKACFNAAESLRQGRITRERYAELDKELITAYQQGRVRKDK